MSETLRQRTIRRIREKIAEMSETSHIMELIKLLISEVYELFDEIDLLKSALDESKKCQMFITFFNSKAEWSIKTFGPGPRTEGVCKHIEKELKEIRSNPTDLYEWVDVILLAMDGAYRAGFDGGAVWHGMMVKQQINMSRSWPNPKGQDEAIEHVREKSNG